MKYSLKRALPAAIALSLGMTALPAAAYEAGDWVVRARVISVSPDEDSSAISASAVPGAVAGSGVSVDNDVVPELDFTYMLDPHWGLELILATSSHDADANGTLTALGNIADAKVLPPTLTLQYHFLPKSNIRPYAGVGINYTYFYDESVEDVLDAPGASVDFDDSWGLAAQVGVDVDINKDWFVNFDVKYIDISTEATFKNTTLGTVTADVDIDPWVFGIGIGTTF
ncbi:OmpW/AlkL family protein [Sulfuriflexus mobilis]|uniref:OmpW/AlkL family protein n=1 Tax=Sulfuriflexus mobilis TaxID=1811807 RepID=UPI000F81CC4E|nr:OmpW family protein [Sulfuriflexus mobilis]